MSNDCPPTVGGAHLWLHEVYKRWQTPVCFLTAERSNLADEAEDERIFDQVEHGALRIVRAAVPLIDINLVSWRCLRLFRQHADAIRRVAASTGARLHALRAFPEGFASLLAKMSNPRRIRLVTYAHGEEVLVARSSRQLKWIANLVYRASDVVIANSENTRRLVRELCPGARVACINPGVDVAAFRHDEHEVARFRAQRGVPAQSVLLGTVARMEPRKNQAAVIRSVALLRKAGMPVSYFCAGEGPERCSLRDLTQSLGISDAVFFPGMISQKHKTLAFAAFDVFAMPSIQVGEMIEGFGIVFLEAGAAGRPSICGTSGGQAEAVRDQETGLVVDGTHPDEVTGAIRRLTLDSMLRKQMGRAAHEWANEHDWPRVVTRTQATIATASPLERP